MIDFWEVKVFMTLLETKKKFLKLTKCPWVRNDFIPNEQRFIFLLETENAPLCCKKRTTFWESLLKHISIPSIRSISGNMTQVSGDLTVNRCEHHTQPLFFICDWKHDEINPVRKVTRFKNVPMSAEWTVNYSRSFIVNITSRQLERENQSNTCHGTTLHPTFKTQCATNSCYGNNKHLMFLKWRPELKKKKKL